jgi:hypothetical protein
LVNVLQRRCATQRAPRWAIAEAAFDARDGEATKSLSTLPEARVA